MRPAWRGVITNPPRISHLTHDWEQIVQIYQCAGGDRYSTHWARDLRAIWALKAPHGYPLRVVDKVRP